MKDSPEISIIVPTYNSASHLNLFLNSLTHSRYKNFEVIINDDARSKDKTNKIIDKYKSKLQITYLKKNQSMAQARKLASTYAKGAFLMHLDSDMQVTPNLLKECMQQIRNGADALIIPEESFGTTFWANCKWLEKRMYVGVSELESVRFLKATLYNSVNGHNKNMVFSEDKDLDIRVKCTGAKLMRTKNHLLHNEGNLKLFSTLRKKIKYSETANIFAKEHPDAYRWQRNVFHRYAIFAKNIQYLFPHPLLYLGLIYMKTTEYIVSFIGLVYSKLISRKMYDSSS